MTLDLQRLPSTRSRRRVVFHDHAPPPEDFRAAVIAGLSRPDKALPCRWLYDAAGSALFDEICTLPEYYPTRTETAILRQNATAIADAAGASVQVVELGSGASEKIRILLDALDNPDAYIPIDISASHLLRSAQALQDDYPLLRVEAICADYAQDFPLPPCPPERRLGFYPGSTIGNLTPTDAEAFLRVWARRLGSGAGMLVGVDLHKDTATLEAAYDDSQGVTAAFSLNLLARANRELGANFDVSRFRHEARYDLDEGRIAIHLRSLQRQTILIDADIFQFDAGECLHIEDSWKYTLADFRELAWRSGFMPQSVWTDARQQFSVHLLRAQPHAGMSQATI